MRDNRVRFSFNYFIHHLFIFVQSGKKNLKFFCFQNYLLLICFVQLNRLSSEIVRLAESYIQMLIKKLFFLNFSKQHCRTRLKLSAEPNKTSDLRLKLSAKPNKSCDQGFQHKWIARNFKPCKLLAIPRLMVNQPKVVTSVSSGADLHLLFILYFILNLEFPNSIQICKYS